MKTLGMKDRILKISWLYIFILWISIVGFHLLHYFDWYFDLKFYIYSRLSNYPTNSNSFFINSGWIPIEINYRIHLTLTILCSIPIWLSCLPFIDKFSLTNIKHNLQLSIRVCLAVYFLNAGLENIFELNYQQPNAASLDTRLSEMSLGMLYYYSIGISKTYAIGLGYFWLVLAILLISNKFSFLGSILAAVSVAHTALVAYGFNLGFDYNIAIGLLFTVILLSLNKDKFHKLVYYDKLGSDPISHLKLLSKWGIVTVLLIFLVDQKNTHHEEKISQKEDLLFPTKNMIYSFHINDREKGDTTTCQLSHWDAMYQTSEDYLIVIKKDGSEESYDFKHNDQDSTFSIKARYPNSKFWDFSYENLTPTRIIVHGTMESDSIKFVAEEVRHTINNRRTFYSQIRVRK